MPESPDAAKEGVAFGGFCLATAFVVFYSVPAIQSWPEPWGALALAAACLAPPGLTLLLFRRGIWRDGKPPWELIWVSVLCLAGFLNVSFSEERGATLKGMGLFLLSGMMPFLAAYWIFGRSRWQKAILPFWMVVLVFLCGYGIYEWHVAPPLENKIKLFSANPIPAGSLLLLLSFGPLVWMSQVKTVWKFLMAGVLLLDVGVLILIGQRGPLLAVFVMAAVLMMQNRRRVLLVLLVALAFVGAVYQYKDKLPSYMERKVTNWEGVLIRLEMYPIAWNILKEHPVMGIGFKTPIINHISPTYRPYFLGEKLNPPFYEKFKLLNTLDNMALSFLAETGLLFSAVYGGFFLWTVRGLKNRLLADDKWSPQDLACLAVLAGFLVHSLTFDSLKFPQLNWIFHSILGWVARYKNP